MKNLSDSLVESILLEASYITFNEKDLDNMSKEELYTALQDAAAAKAFCFVRKDKKGEAEMADMIAKIRKMLA
jgi:hypothetical protein